MSAPTSEEVHAALREADAAFAEDLAQAVARYRDAVSAVLAAQGWTEREMRDARQETVAGNPWDDFPDSFRSTHVAVRALSGRPFRPSGLNYNPPAHRKPEGQGRQNP